MTAAAAPTAARSLALAEVRAAVRAHGLTPGEVFPPAEVVGLVDLDAIKAAGLNSDTVSQRLLAGHRDANRDTGTQLMATRLLREGIISSDRVNKLDAAEEVFYRRLMSKVDDHGLYDARPPMLRSSLYPLRVDRVREADITRWIASCEKAGLIVLYVNAEKPYLQMRDTGWVARSEPKYPRPTDPGSEILTTSENSCKQEKATAPVFVVEDVVEDDVCAEPSGPALFDEFWKAYPKKRAKDDALKAFTKRRPTRALLDAMLKAIAEQRASPDWLKEKGQFIPYPATWLNDGRWQDVSETDSPALAATPQSSMFEQHSAYLAAEAAREATSSPEKIRAAREAVHAARLGSVRAVMGPTAGARDAHE